MVDDGSEASDRKRSDKMKKQDDGAMNHQEFMAKSDEILNTPTPNEPERLKPKVNHGPSKVTSKSLSTEDMKRMILGAELTSKNLYQEPSKWIFKFNEFHRVAFVYKSDSVTKDGHKVDMRTYMAFLRTTIKEMGLAKSFSNQSAEDMVTLWLSREKERFLREFRLHMSFKASAEDLIRTWVRAATGRESEVDIAVMRHFVWQVRRKLFGLEVEHHMMPILYGKSGGGKSQAVLQLLKPMEDLSLSMDLSIFSDQFRTRLFSKAYVMFFDEMAKSDRADIDRLKNVITSPTVDFRQMHSENIESATQNCTFIGCSNDTVYDKIYDPTSARRYWQLNCADKLDWQAINAIPYLDLWRSVDEKSDCPIRDVLSEVSAVQHQTLRSKDLVEDWAEAILSIGAVLPKVNPSTLELYESFKQHCAFQKINNVPTLNKFSRRLPQVLQNLGWNMQSYRNHRGTLWPLIIGTPLNTLVNRQEIYDRAAEVDAFDLAKDRAEMKKR